MAKKVSDTLRDNIKQAIKDGADQEHIDWLLDWADDK